MKKIQLWSVDRTEGKLSATAVESVDNTKTEQDLEELLVASPVWRRKLSASAVLDQLIVSAHESFSFRKAGLL